MAEQQSNGNKCLSQLLSCLQLLKLYVPIGGGLPAEKGPSYHDPKNPSNIRGLEVKTRKKKGKKYHPVTNLPNSDEENEDDEDLTQGDLEEGGSQNKGPKKAFGEEEQHQDPQQFFNEFSSWRSDQQVKQQKETELSEIKKPQQKKNLLTMSENEIDQQQNTISGDNEELFASFAAPKKLQPPPMQRQLPKKQEVAAAQISSFLNNLPDNTQPSGDSPVMPQLQLDEELQQPDQTSSNKESGAGAAGWGGEDDLDINFE